ncbi:lipoprotein, partial [Rhizobium ruizarguesonis]
MPQKRISMKSLPHLVRLTAVLSVIVFAVAGCGRKGDLDPPSAAATKEGDGSRLFRRLGNVAFL